jgi:hypothetical protein
MNRNRQRIYTGVGIFLAVIMAVTLFLPGLAPQQPAVQDVPPTPAAAATFPPPVTDFTGIGFEETYLHPSGLFTVAVPTGWNPNRPSNNGTQVQVNMNNDQNLTVIESYIEVPAQPVADLDALSDRFNDAVLQAGWRSYSSWRETQRVIDETEQQLEIDFVLTLGQQTYIARHIAWLEENVVKVVRVVAPENARDLLLYLLQNVPPTLSVVDLFEGSPTIWNALYSPRYQHIIRYPNTWVVVDGDPSVAGPVTIEGVNNEVLRVDAVEGGSITDEAAAEQFVRAIRPNATIAGVVPVEQGEASGFSVSYNSQTLEGVQLSGIMVILNDAQGNAHMADLRIQAPAVDFNNIDAVTTVYQDVPVIMSSFNLTTGEEFPVVEPETGAEVEATPVETAPITGPEPTVTEGAPADEIDPTPESPEDPEGDEADNGS